MKIQVRSFPLRNKYVQVRFISFIPSDLFHNFLHTLESIYTFTLKQLRSLNATDSNEMSQTVCLQLLKQDLLVCIVTVRPVIFDICEIAAMHFKFISRDTHE